MQRTGTPNIVGHEGLILNYWPRFADDRYPWLDRETDHRWHQADVRDITPEPEAQEG